MRTSSTKTLCSLLLVALGALSPVACAEWAGLQPKDGEDPAGGPSGPADTDCEGPLGKPADPNALPACCADFGGAHCVADVPDELTSFVGACEGGGYCMPDDFIRTGGVFTPASCNSINGDGVCLSRCIPDVQANSGILKQDTCAASELCVPCVSPLDGKETGACDLGFTCEDSPKPGGGSTGGGADDPATCVHEGPPVLDPASRPACPSCGGGHCLENELLSPDQIENFSACDSASSCVPDEFIVTGGDFVLETCASVGGAEGRCVSKCLPEIAAQADQLPQSTCADTHACAPCFDPFDGTATGICSLSCDTGPTEPPKPLPRCCGDVGQCVPSDLLPADKAENFSSDTCPQGDGSLTCVPDMFLEGSYTPIECETSFIAFLFGDAYRPGACLPECMPAVDGQFGLSQDGCPDSFKCAPCLDPLSGEPSGACDAQ